METESGFFQFCEVSVLCVNRVQVVPSSLTAYYFFTDKARSNLFEIHVETGLNSDKVLEIFGPNKRSAQINFIQ